MTDGVAIGGISIATLALIISIICLTWIIVHVLKVPKPVYDLKVLDREIFHGGTNDVF